MSTLKQATLNAHVNSEAVEAYVQRLALQAEHLTDRAWPDEATGADAEARTTLYEAAEAMRDALRLARDAERLASDRAYARIYGEKQSSA
jgi:hypothetical protein